MDLALNLIIPGKVGDKAVGFFGLMCKSLFAELGSLLVLVL